MVTAKLLQELNEDVSTKFVEAEPSELLVRTPEFFDSFTMVVATNVPEHVTRTLGRRCWARRVPCPTTPSRGHADEQRSGFGCSADCSALLLLVWWVACGGSPACR